MQSLVCPRRIVIPTQLIARATHHKRPWRYQAQHQFRGLVFIGPPARRHARQIRDRIVQCIHATAQINHHIRCTAGECRHLHGERGRVEAGIVARHVPCHAVLAGLHGRIRAVAGNRPHAHRDVRILIEAGRIHPHVCGGIVREHLVVDVDLPVPRVLLRANDVAHAHRRLRRDCRSHRRSRHQCLHFRIHLRFLSVSTKSSFPLTAVAGRPPYQISKAAQEIEHLLRCFE